MSEQRQLWYSPPTMHQPGTIDAAFFSGIEKPVSFYILRHGETTANAAGRIQGRLEYSLNDNGRAQAMDLAEYLRDKGIVRLFHSPLARAAETAAIVASTARLPDPEVEQHLVELDTGHFSGLNWDEIRLRYPEEHNRFRYESWEAVLDAERSARLYERAIAAWTALRSAAIESRGNVAAISHGGTIQWLVRATFGCRTWMPLVTTGNCGVFELYVEPSDPGMPAYMQWKEINMLPDGDGVRVAPVF